MSRFEWDMDELLNFDYGKPVPDGRTTAGSQPSQASDSRQGYASESRQAYVSDNKQGYRIEQRQKDDAQLSAEIKRKEEEKAIKEAQLREYMASARRAQERAKEERHRQQMEIDLRAQAEAREIAERERQLQLALQREQQVRQQKLQREQIARQQQAQSEQAVRQQMTFGEAPRPIQDLDAERLAAQRAAAQRAQMQSAEAQKAAAQRAAYERYRAESRNQHASKEERKIVNQQIREDQRALRQEKRNANRSSRTDGYRVDAQSGGAGSAKASSGKSSSNAGSKKGSGKKGKANSNSSKYAKKSKGAKALSGLYIIAMIVFSISMLIMNVLPFKYLVLMYGALALLSIILVAQLTGSRVKKWARGVAVFMSVILLMVYGVGSAYALGTLSFLGTTSVDNEDSVAKITEDPFNVVMTGIDVNGKIDTQGRSDVNMIVTVNPETATILMTSIPRDYEIRMPDKGYATDKLTHTGFYGVETTILAEEDLFGIESNYYVKVNFSTVKNFINAIGGVDVYSEYTFNPVKMKSWTVQEGMNHMSGEQALAFARERKAFITGDNQRIKNQQAVFEALIEKATSSKTMAISYGKILNQLTDYFEMSFSSSEIRNLMKFQIAANPEWKIYKSTVTGPGASKATYTGGSQKLYVMQQDPTEVANAKALINAVLEGKELQKDDNGVVSIVATE